MLRRTPQVIKCWPKSILNGKFNQQIQLFLCTNLRQRQSSPLGGPSFMEHILFLFLSPVPQVVSSIPQFKARRRIPSLSSIKMRRGRILFRCAHLLKYVDKARLVLHFKDLPVMDQFQSSQSVFNKIFKRYSVFIGQFCWKAGFLLCRQDYFLWLLMTL